jgi:hypothetical protein
VAAPAIKNVISGAGYDGTHFNASRRIFMRETAAKPSVIFCASPRYPAHCSEMPMSSDPIDEAVAALGQHRPPATEAPSGTPTVFELDRMLTLDEVAKFRGLSKDSIRRHYPHLIRRLSPRRRGMNLRDALTIGNLR